MKKGAQKTLGAVRPPRVQISYDVEIGDAVTQRTLPFVIAVFADLAGDGAASQTRLRDRSFVQLDTDNFDAVMASIRPTLKLSVPNCLDGEAQTMDVEMSFGDMNAFAPASIARAVPPLAKLMEKRARLTDLLAKLDGNDRLNDLLAEVVNNTELLSPDTGK